LISQTEGRTQANGVWE